MLHSTGITSGNDGPRDAAGAVTMSQLVQAMNGAEAAAPSLQGYFGCWQICDGVPRCFQTEEQP